MAFKLYIPTSHNVNADLAPGVRFFANKGGKRLSINAPALALCGFKAKDKLVIEFDEENENQARIRIATPEDGPNFTQLSQGKAERSGSFNLGGRALYDLGYEPGLMPAECGPGWIIVEPKVLGKRDPNAPPIVESKYAYKNGEKPEAGKTTPPPAPAAPKATPPAPAPQAAPTTPTPVAPGATQAPQAARSVPNGYWTLQTTPKVTSYIVQALIEKKAHDVIAKDMGVTTAQVRAVAESFIAPERWEALGKASFLERTQWLEQALGRWQAKYDATPEDKRP